MRKNKTPTFTVYPKDFTVDYGNYRIVEYKAGDQRFYQARIKLAGVWWYSKNFHPTILKAGDEARSVIYSLSDRPVRISINYKKHENIH